MYGVNDMLHIYPLCDIFYFRAIDNKYYCTWQEGTNGFSVSSERHWQSGVKEIANVSKRTQCYSNP